MDESLLVRRGAGTLLQVLPTRRVLGATRRVRGVGLALLWHRIRPSPPAASDVVETVRTEVFRRQLRALTRIADVVPLAALDDREAGARPRIALTFDDDDAGHARFTLPVLVELGLPATFFLSGRWLHGLGPYWWEMLERRIAAEGVDGVAAALGSSATTAQQLAVEVEGTEVAHELARAGDAATDEHPMTHDDARQLVAAGMEIGFHTIDHPVLPLLDADTVVDAVRRGRAELEQDLDVPVARFAYPHGRLDAVSRRAVAEAGFVSAWSCSPTAARPDDDPHARPRWEPARRDPAWTVSGVTRRLLAGAR